MPNFHTHWLVAVRALGHAPPDVQAGWKEYRKRGVEFGEEVRKAFEKVDSEKKIESFRDTTQKLFDTWRKNIGAVRMDEPRSWMDRKLHGIKDEPKFAPCRDDVTCFSAYMLGACGPDFWMFPSNPRGMIPDVASEQFNLGHYNRSHRQFQASVQAIGNGTALQDRVQRAYFYGMATHIAADLIVHELVNIMAGAYNLVEELWFHEAPSGMMDKAKKWHLHNKVEHYWDSYVRYAKFGDLPDPFAGAGAPQDHSAASEGGLLTLDSLLESKPHFRKLIEKDELRFMVERPIAFPGMFCDRVLARDGLVPFIYDVVIQGAHPVAEVHPLIAAERDSYQMKDRGKNEGKKLEFFSTKLSEGKERWSWNYLAYDVCPRLDRLRLFGQDVFYKLSELDRFVNAGASLAAVFLGDLTAAYARGKRASIEDVYLPNLGRFWNLDTGLGLEVKNVTHRVSKEVVTVLDFVHATSIAGASLDHHRGARDTGYLGLHDAEQKFGAGELRAFETRRDETFRTWGDVEEPDQDAFLPRLRVGKLPALPPLRPEEVSGGGGSASKRRPLDDCLFDGAAAPGSAPAPAPTRKLAKHPKIELAPLANRLTLALKVPITRFGAKPEELGLFVYGDGVDKEEEAEATGLSEGYINKEMTREWLSPEKGAAPGRLIEFQKGEGQGHQGDARLQTFWSRLLFPLDPVAPKRKVKKGEWNNVIPLDNELKCFGRNFAIATGRRFVLHPTDPAGTVFDPLPHDTHTPFRVYSDVSPTEHIFFSLHVLTKGLDGKVRDAMTRKVVTRGKLAEIRRIDAAGFVKLVLYYVLRPDGAFQLDTCHIDGVPVRIKTEG